MAMPRRCCFVVLVILLLDFAACFSHIEMEEQKSFKITWERGVVETIESNLKKSTARPFVMALVGIPGSGKTTSAAILRNLLQANGVSTLVMPFDGYHYPMATLRSFNNAADFIYRRGAPDTFDANALRTDLMRIRSGSEAIVKLPGFDHAKGDPEIDSHVFERSHHELVICEGLYLLHQEDGWQMTDSFDFSVFIESDVDRCVERLKIRNKVIPGYTPEEIEIRVDEVDRVNALTVLRSKPRANLVVQSAAEF